MYHSIELSNAVYEALENIHQIYLNSNLLVSNISQTFNFSVMLTEGNEFAAHSSTSTNKI
jgi:hypothetical protein